MRVTLQKTVFSSILVFYGLDPVSFGLCSEIECKRMPQAQANPADHHRADPG